jgi:hypothetical protein
MDSLYIVSIAFDATFANPSDINPSCFIIGTHNNTHETIWWYHRLAHLNIFFMKEIQTKTLSFMPIILDFTHLPFIESYIMGKHHKDFFSPISLYTPSNAILDLVHFDICGLM